MESMTFNFTQAPQNEVREIVRCYEQSFIGLKQTRSETNLSEMSTMFGVSRSQNDLTIKYGGVPNQDIRESPLFNIDSNNLERDKDFNLFWEDSFSGKRFC